MTSRPMKNSHIEWLKNVPANWEVIKLKYLCNIKTGNKDTVNREDDGLYPFYVRSPKIERINSFSYEGEAILTAGDGVGAGKVFHYAKGKFDYHQRVYNLHHFKGIYGKFLFHYLKNNFIREVEKGTAKSTVDSIRLPMLQNFPVAVPPAYEQKKIADFLDEKVSKIDSILSDTKESIEALKQYKQSLITETVTKGLKPDVSMKNSEVEWIGEIPEHWNTIKIKYSSYLKGRIGWQGLTSNEYQDEGPYLITGKDFQNGSINWETCTHITEERYEEAPDIHVQNNDLLITKDGTIGKVALVTNLNSKASLNSGVLLIRKTKEVYHEKFLYYVLTSEIFWKWYHLIKPPNSTILHLYQSDFKEFRYTNPPIEEQQQIAYYLDERTKHIDSLIQEKQQLINELETYKKSLIYEYVTGKKEVK